ncbi:MAG: hypothetical protein ACRDUX_32085 [Mycobacterium sp.]
MPSLTPKNLRPAIWAAVLVVGISGCSGTDPASPAPSALPGLPGAVATTSTQKTTPTTTANAADYQRLLVTAADLSDADDTFHPRSNQAQPNGQPGASAFFVNDQDTRAITSTVLIYPDAAAASAALKQTSQTLTDTVAGGAPTPSPVGTDGVTISGTYPEDDKAVTLLYFTEGRALVRLEFQSATGDVTTDRFVTDIGKMQQIALRVGLTDAQ